MKPFTFPGHWRVLETAQQFLVGVRRPQYRLNMLERAWDLCERFVAGRIRRDCDGCQETAAETARALLRHPGECLTEPDTWLELLRSSAVFRLLRFSVPLETFIPHTVGKTHAA